MIAKLNYSQQINLSKHCAANMSSIIDEDAFQLDLDNQPHPLANPVFDFPAFSSRSIKGEDDWFLLQRKEGQVQIVKKIVFNNQEYLAKLKAGNKAVKITVILLNGSNFYRCLSPAIQNLFVKEVGKRQRECVSEANYCINKGRVMIVLNNLILVGQKEEKYSLRMYTQIIKKIICSLEEFAYKHLKIARKKRIEEPALSALESQLTMGRTLITTHSNMTVSDDRSQYKFVKKEQQRQIQQIKLIENRIVKDEFFEKNVNQLFKMFPQQTQALFISQNFVSSFEKKFKGMRSLLHLALTLEKRPEDYLFSNVSIQIVAKVAGGRPIAEGGSSLIFAFNSMITFCSLSPGLQKNEEKIETMIAVKKLRQGSEKKRDKIEHEKKIVSQLSNSICHFLPKYYNVQSESELKSCLVMELVAGDELDTFLEKQLTLSLWSKVYILLNILQGLRHLVSQKIVHLDLKPSNIIVGRSYITKIIDFGEAYHQKVCSSDYLPGFTFPYTAPQIYGRVRKKQKCIEDKFQFSEKQDAFAFGIILSQVIFNNRIFYFSKAKSKEVYGSQRLLDRFFHVFENNEVFGDDLQMSTLQFIIERCIDQPERRPLFQWVEIILKTMLNSYINY